MFLLKRGKALSRAGWRDKLDDRNENPPGPPWGRFGDNRTARIIQGVGMELGTDQPGGWFPPAPPNGGWGYAYQPQTDAWAVEFVRSMPSYGNNHRAHVYIDQDWTAGQNGEALGGQNRYQVYIEFNRYQTKTTKKDKDGNETTETNDYYHVTLGFRDIQDTSIDWFNNQPNTGTAATTDVGAATWNGPMRVRLCVYGDNLFLLYVNGTLRFGLRYNNANYNLEPGHRAANFAHKEGVAFRIRDFSTEDITPMPDWSNAFTDDFNRPNNSSIGNGWTKRGTNGAILNGAYSMQSNGGDGLGSIARNAGNFNQRIDVTFGGGTGDPADLVPGFIHMRMNAAGTQGLYFRIQKGNMDLWKWTSTTMAGGEPSSTRVLGLPAGYLGAVFNNGDRIRITMWEDLMIVERNGEVLHIREGMLATGITNRSNTWAGLGVNHGAFIVNSVPFNTVTIAT